MSTDLNMEYQEVKFGEIANHISKRVEPSETTLEIYVGLEHLDPDSLKITRHGVPSDVAGQKLLVKKGQIIFGKRRAYQRKVAVADWDCICSAHAMVLEAIPGKILPEFLPFFMQSNQFMERAVDISEGSLSPTIKWKILEQQLFKIPMIDDQKRIIRLCQSTQGLEDSISQSIQAFSKVKLKAWIELKKIFERSSFINLSDCANVIDPHPSHRAPEIDTDGIPFIGIGDIDINGIIDFSTVRLVSKNVLKEHKKRYQITDKVFGFGRVASIGKVIEFKNTNGDYVISPTIALVEVKKEDDYEYFRLLMSSSYYMDLIKPYLTGSTRVSIGMNKLRDIKVPYIKDLEKREKVINIMKYLENIDKCLVVKQTNIKEIKLCSLNKL
jgi:restriction endonuclease S subunit